jgi:hypothetical protein
MLLWHVLFGAQKLSIISSRSSPNKSKDLISAAAASRQIQYSI